MSDEVTRNIAEQRKKWRESVAVVIRSAQHECVGPVFDPLIHELGRVLEGFIGKQELEEQSNHPLFGLDTSTGQALELNRETGQWQTVMVQQQANIVASHEAANEEMDDEKELMRGFLDEAEREFRRCKQEPGFATWALRFGLKIIQAARGELKWQVSTE